MRRGATVVGMFTTRPNTTLLAGRSHQEALEAWRDAADIVGVRWQIFLDAGSESRPGAFARYVAALDAEEALAAELAAVAPTALAA